MRTIWIALQRSGKDQRARKLLAIAAVNIVFLLYYVAWALYTFVWVPRPGTRADMFLMYGIIAVNLAVTFLIVRRSRRSQHVVLGDALRASPDSSPGVTPAVRTYLVERAMILSSLVTRAASEAYLQDHPDQSEAAAITRQAQNTLLRVTGLWEKLELNERDLSSSAHGSWTEDQRASIVIWCEQLRLLRWVLGMDAAVSPLALFPRADFALTQGLAEPPTGGLTRESWDVRVERDMAAAYVSRILAEQQHRGWLTEEAQAQTTGWAEQFREQLAGDSKDYLAGTKTVAQLDNDTLRYFSGIVLARWRYACYLVEQLSASQPFSLAAWESAGSRS